MKTLFIIAVLCLFASCNDLSKDCNTKEASARENPATGNGLVLDTFVKTKFGDRAEELIYIRKYIEYKLPKIIIEAEPDKMEHALEVLVGNGKNVTLEEAVKYTWMYRGDYDRLWYVVTEEDLSFVAVKKKLLSYEALHPKGQQKSKEETIILPDKRENDDVELPPVADGEYTSADGKIRGDFNGDGHYEYAFRVLTKKGYGNPVEDGIPDEYEIHFSDRKLKPIKVDCCWFELVNEGDLNNDGSDEFSIAQNPMNGCIGTFRTFTCEKDMCFELLNPFVFYRCDEITKSEFEELVTSENRIIYYREIDPNGEGLIKKRATLKI